MRGNGLFWSFVAAMLLAALSAGVYLAWPLWEATPPAAPQEAAIPRPIRVTIGETNLTVPRDLLRFPGQRRDGPAERVELVLRWPPHEANRPEFHAENSIRGNVFITLSAPDDSLDPTRRFGAIYQRYLSEDSISAPSGLAGRRFNADSGYDGEELFYDPASPTSFFARCAAPIADQPGICIRELRLGDRLDVVYRFPRTVLPGWARLDKTIAALLAAIGANEH